jgi:hypothetical protein
LIVGESLRERVMIRLMGAAPSSAWLEGCLSLDDKGVANRAPTSRRINW